MGMKSSLKLAVYPLALTAAELAFPGARWNLAFEFTPPQPVTFDGTALRFPIGCLEGEA